MAIVSPRASLRYYPIAPVAFYGALRDILSDLNEPDRRLYDLLEQLIEGYREHAEVTNRIMHGKVNATFEVTLATSAASTVVSHPLIGDKSAMFPMPLTANAVAELYSGTMWVSSQGKETATITHANNTLADRTFRYVVFG